MSHSRHLTVFGTVLADLFIALIWFNVSLAWVFGLSYWYSRGINLMACRPDKNDYIDPQACIDALYKSAQPAWLTILNRSFLISAGCFIIVECLGVAWEMGRSRTGNQMLVRADDIDVVVSEYPDRRGVAPGRRAEDWK